MFKGSIIGNLGADAVVKTSNGGKFITFRVADTQKWTDEKGESHSETTWVDVVYNVVDSPILQYLRAGVKVFVRGHLRLRLYSSPKLRKMVAGATIVAQEIELCGGASDEIPRQVVDTRDGSIFDTKKYFWIPVDTKKMKKDEVLLFTDSRGHLFHVDKLGFVSVAPAEVDSQVENADGQTKEDER